MAAPVEASKADDHPGGIQNGSQSLAAESYSEFVWEHGGYVGPVVFGYFVLVQ